MLKTIIIITKIFSSLHAIRVRIDDNHQNIHVVAKQIWSYQVTYIHTPQCLSLISLQAGKAVGSESPWVRVQLCVARVGKSSQTYTWHRKIHHTQMLYVPSILIIRQCILFQYLPVSWLLYTEIIFKNWEQKL